MGGHGYSCTSRYTRSVDDGYTTKSRSELFKSRTLDNQMNPKGVTLREARDSEVHPNSLGIVLGLDVTGSMGFVPHELCKDGLPKVMGNLIQNGVKDAAILFLAIGDHECDNYPLQVGQFESGDELLDKWLTTTYLEGGGGGNAGESYLLAWFFAARYTVMDCLEKRGKKGYLITIGDEPCLRRLPASAQKEIMGDGQYRDLTAAEILGEAQEKFEVYHLNVTTTSSGRYVQQRPGNWAQLLHDRFINVSMEDVPATIARIVANGEGVQDVKFVDSVEELSEIEQSANPSAGSDFNIFGD